MDPQATRETHDALLGVERPYAIHEVDHVGFCNAEALAGLVGDAFFFGSGVRAFEVLVEDKTFTSVLANNVLDFVPQHEPEVVDAVQTQRERDDGLGTQLETGAIDLRARDGFDDDEAHATLRQKPRHVPRFLGRTA